MLIYKALFVSLHGSGSPIGLTNVTAMRHHFVAAIFNGSSLSVKNQHPISHLENGYERSVGNLKGIGGRGCFLLKILEYIHPS